MNTVTLRADNTSIVRQYRYAVLTARLGGCGKTARMLKAACSFNFPLYLASSIGGVAYRIPFNASSFPKSLDGAPLRALAVIADCGVHNSGLPTELLATACDQLDH